jgi:hypothetical protein
MSDFPDSTAKVTAITPCGENKVRITVELVVHVHRLAEVSSSMLHVAAKGVADEKKKLASAEPNP